MKTIDDLPVEVLANILSFTTPFIDIFIKLRLINSKWNEAVKYRLSMVKHLIQGYDHRYSKPPILAETMFSIAATGPYFNHSGWDDKYTTYFISLMEMLPGLQAVKMRNLYRLRETANGYEGDPLHDLSIQNRIFSYFNSRPTIKTLAIRIDWPWKDNHIEAELEKAVKLQNITMLSIESCKAHNKNFKQFIEYFFPTDHEFEQLWLADVTDVSFIFQKKTKKIRKLYHQIDWKWHKDNELDLIMTNHLCDLEIFGVLSCKVDILEYLSKVTSLSPKLTSIHVVISSNVRKEPMKNFKQFNQVENLVIEGVGMRNSFSYAEKILRMYPMVKNLSIKYSSDLSQDKILGIFRWMPNLSVLHLGYYKAYKGRYTREALWTVNVDYLVSAYNQLHGRLIKIRVTEKVVDHIDIFSRKQHVQITFKRGYDFMKHFFYSYDYDHPHILIE